MPTERQQKLFVLYDGRAKGGDTDDAAVLVSSNSEREAKRDTHLFRGYDAIWYEYDIDTDGKTMINEKARPDLGKGLL